MEVVIKIPEHLYEMYKGLMLSGDTGLNTTAKLIANGTPLPKGHGRLGDLSKIYVELNEAQIEGTEGYKGLGEAKQIVCDAPTIIESDTESEVKE